MIQPFGQLDASSTDDALQAAHVTLYAADELARGHAPAARYALLARYPAWRQFLDLIPPYAETPDWRRRLLRHAHTLGAPYAEAVEHAVQEQDEALEGLLHDL